MGRNKICPKRCSQCIHSAKIRSAHRAKTVCTIGRMPLFGLARFCKNVKKEKR